MPRSQDHRPGVKVIKSPKDSSDNKHQNDQKRLKKQLKRASHLEEELNALQGGSGTGGTQHTSSNNKSQPVLSNDLEVKARNLRTHLCEIFSDIIVLSPIVALQKDIFIRLWKGCFYVPISAWRSRLAREKRKNLSTLPQTQAGYRQYLKEAIILYEYLIKQYLSLLCPPESTQDTLTPSSQQSSQDSTILDSQQTTQDDNDNDDDSETTAEHGAAPTTSSTPTNEGVVQGLYKLYIYLGDLYRYEESFNKAETNYLNASRLGPGVGNPYNQLAVVAFTKDTYCVSLYWYARSLLASHEEKMSTNSSNNLKRLFDSNRKYIHEYGRTIKANKPTVLKLPPTTTGTNNKKQSKADMEMIRAQKQAASKSCLAYFVDLHYDFYERKEDERSMRDKMVAVIASLESLLEVSGFGDSLLCKMVVINSFSMEHAAAKMTHSRGENAIANATTTYGLTREFMYMLGSSLAQRLEGLLMKTLEKGNQNKPLPSVRLLLPLELLVEFVIPLWEETNNDDNNKSTFLQAAQTIFWQRLVAVGNLLQQISNRFQEENSNILSTPETSHSFANIKEYQLLKGYRPFRIMNDEYIASCTDGFLGPEGAKDVLGLNNLLSQSQETTTTGASTSTAVGIEENKARLIRMLELCQILSSSKSKAPVSTKKDKSHNVFVYNPHAASDVDESSDNNNNTNNFADDDEDDDMTDVEDIVVQRPPRDNENVEMRPEDDIMDDEAGDVVLYQLPKNGNGPPLLVPGDLMSVSTKSAPPESSLDTIANMGTAPGDDTQKENSASFAAFGNPASSAKSPPGQASTNVEMADAAGPPPASVMPPPGFFAGGGPPGLSSQNQAPAGNAATATEPNFLPAAMMYDLPNTSQPSSSYPASAPGGDFLFGGQQTIGHHPLTVAQSLHLFGDMQTANPFAPSYPIMGAAPSNPNLTGFAADDNMNAGGAGDDDDDTKYLDTGLLMSLFGETTTETNNPWATK